MLKVLQINVINKHSSTGRTTTELAKEIQKAGMESRIAVAEGMCEEDTYIIGKRLERRMHALCSRIFGLQGYFSYWGTRKLLKYMDNEKPDVVHLRNLHGNYINVPVLFKYLQKHNLPTVITLHDCWFYTGKCCHYTSAKCYKWQDGKCGKCPKLRDDNVSWFFDKTFKMIKDKKRYIDKLSNVAVVGVSQWITDEAKKSYIFSNVENIIKIYNWIDDSVFYPREVDDIKSKLGLEDQFVILSVASGWSNKKGLDKIKKVAENLPNDMAIVLVGRCEEEVTERNIIVVGETKDTNELAEFYSMADVYLNMSKEESFGKVSAEALMCGTPVIALNFTANPEIVGENCGYVVNDFDEREIVKKIEQIKHKGKKNYTEACLEFAKNNFSKSENTKNYIELYKSMVEKKENVC